MRLLIAVLKRLFPRMGWNMEYRSGHWDHRLHGCPEALTEVLRINPHDVVDLGCGNGVFAKTLFDSGWHGVYRGFDLSPEAISRARKLCPEASFAVTDIASVSAHCDCLIMLESVYYLPVETARKLVSSINFRCAVIRIHDSVKHLRYVEMLEEEGFSITRTGTKGCLSVLEKQPYLIPMPEPIPL